MYPCTWALMLALMNPSSVATRSSTRGTSCGATVVTRTSGAGGPTCAGLREQLHRSDSEIRMAATIVSRFIISLLLIAICSVERRSPGHRFFGLRACANASQPTTNLFDIAQRDHLLARSATH